MNQHDQPAGTGNAKFDRVLGSLSGLPGSKITRPSTVLTTVPILNVTTTAVIQTYRSKEGAYTVFLQLVDGDGHLRIVLPDKVCQALYRQRESVVDRSTPDSRARAKAKREREKARQAKEKRRRIASTPFDEEAARRWNERKAE